MPLTQPYLTASEEWRDATGWEASLFQVLAQIDSEIASCLANAAATLRTASVGSSGDYVRVEFAPGQLELGADSNILLAWFAPDSDGVPIELLVSSRENRVIEFELIRVDGDRIQELPAPASFRPTPDAV